MKRIFPIVLTAWLVIAGCNAPGGTPVGEPPTEPVVPPQIIEPPPMPQHEMMPVDLPAERNNHAGDHDSSLTADQKRAPGGDRFTFGRFERPFNANSMDVYFPHLDIQEAMFYQDDTWAYAVIRLKDRDVNGRLSGKYGFEVDLDLNGGGDWLVLVEHPESPEWTTDGVQVWFDSDEDVGGVTTVNADNHGAGNGYETLVFDRDTPDDPDLAWARISPEDPNTIQLAVKLSLLEGDVNYMVGMWAGTGDLDPSLFDLNDHYTHEQAGTALVELEYFYPIKELSEIDNTCRMTIGFEASGSEPGLCKLNVVQEEAPSGCPPENIVCTPGAASRRICYCVEN